ncbi:hypothetical protein OSTOST_02989, partial [Ostertagia ostertagi]
MIHLRHWLFAKKDLIIYVILATVILYFKYNRDDSNESTKTLTVDEFARIYRMKYGQERILEKSICLMDGRCVNIADGVDPFVKEFSLIRQMLVGGFRISQMRLKLPSELLSTNLDSSLWEINRGGLASDTYLMTMVGEVFESGALDLRHDVTGKVLSIGLGAGYINTFLHYHFPKLNITVVELDPKMLEIAQKWYGLEVD